jgi:pleiotropic regulator 1
MFSPSLAPESARLSLKRARELFDHTPQDAFLPSVDKNLHEIAIARRLRTQYNQQIVAEIKNEQTTALVVSNTGETAKRSSTVHQSTAGVLARLQEQKEAEDNKPQGILVKSRQETNIPTPTWHAPWKLSTVLSSHLGWVRSVAIDPTNEMFATGGGDRVIKVWDLAKASVGASDALKITLTGHISPVRGLAFSDRHPYLFSAGEDKQVKCWDLETNQVIRHYHGHLSGIFALSLHPTLDILVTGGRDAVARVWDIRSKNQIHVLSGHDHTIASILTKSTDPQIITGSHDTTIKMWAAGKCFTTLTHHMKSVRALTQPSFEHTFVSGAADCLKKWQGKDGRFLKSYRGHKAVVNALAVNDDGVLVSGGDDGSLQFRDYETGYCFQSTSTIAQPGSLEAENGIFASAFDLTGTRLITCEADKTVKIWKQDDEASDETHPIDMTSWRKECIAESKMRY